MRGPIPVSGVLLARWALSIRLPWSRYGPRYPPQPAGPIRLKRMPAAARVHRRSPSDRHLQSLARPPTVAWHSMQPQETPRLLFVHAHPDDETLTTGATIAHYVARGAEVHVVTCTLGEEGEVIGDRYAKLAVDAADQLGGYRIGELSTALRALGVAEPIFLGGAGRWRDSGMAGTPPRHWHRFVDANTDEAVGELVTLIRQLRPHVVVTYDSKGGYGHPDHIHAHEVTMAAVAASGAEKFAGAPWTVPKVYWTVISTSAMAEGLKALGDAPAGWLRVS